jgi:hypothetical protein
MHNLIYFVNLYIFRAYLDLSSVGTTVCVQQDDCLLSWLDWKFQSNQDNGLSSKKNYKYQLLYTYSCTSL